MPQEGRDAKDQVGGLGMTDPPGHTTLRRYLTPEFTKKRLARLEPLIERIVSERLDALAAAGPDVDLVHDFAFPVPFEVICELLGPAGGRPGQVPQPGRGPVRPQHRLARARSTRPATRVTS